MQSLSGFDHYDFFPQINSQFSLEKKIDNFSSAISPKKYKLTNTENWCENQYVRFYFFFNFLSVTISHKQNPAKNAI